MISQWHIPKTSLRRNATSSWDFSPARSTSTSAATQWLPCPPPPTTWSLGVEIAGLRRRAVCGTSTQASPAASTGTASRACHLVRRSCEWLWSKPPHCCTGAASSLCASPACGCGLHSGSTSWSWLEYTWPCRSWSAGWSCWSCPAIDTGSPCLPTWARRVRCWMGRCSEDGRWGWLDNMFPPMLSKDTEDSVVLACSVQRARGSPLRDPMLYALEKGVHFLTVCMASVERELTFLLKKKKKECYFTCICVGFKEFITQKCITCHLYVFPCMNSVI